MAIIDRRGTVISASGTSESNVANPGLGIKAPVRVATVGANVTLSGLQTIDGVALGVGDRVLVMDQTDLRQNGIYNAGASAWSRAVDFDGTDDVTQGLLITVAQGAINAGAMFELTAPSGTITPGTSTLVFSRAAAAANVQAVFDGGGTPITVGAVIHAEVPSRMTLKRWTLLADRVGSIQVDVWKGPFASLPLSSGNAITGGAYPTLTSQQFNQVALNALSGWQLGLNAGEVLKFTVLSVALVQKVTLSLYGTRP